MNPWWAFAIGLLLGVSLGVILYAWFIYAFEGSRKFLEDEEWRKNWRNPN